MFRTALPWLALSLILLLQAITPAVAISQIPESPSDLTVSVGTIISPPPTGKTYYVDAQPGKNCTGGGGTSYRTTQRDCGGSDGTKSWTTPQGVVSSLVPGDTVLLRAGTYTATGSNSVLSASAAGTSGSRITWQAYTGETPIFTAQTCSTCGFGLDVSASYQTFDGIKINGGRAGLIHTGESTIFGTEFINGEVSNTWGSGFTIGGCYGCAVRNSKVHDTNQMNWPRGNMSSGWGAGIGALGATNFTAEDNTIYWNHGEGLSAGSGGSGAIFRRNVVADNYSVNIYLDGAKNATVDSNLVYQTNVANEWPDPYNGWWKSHAKGIHIANEVGNNKNTINNLTIINNIVVNTDGGVTADSNIAGSTWSGWLIANNTLIGRTSGPANGSCIAMPNSPSGATTAMTVKNNICTKHSYAQMLFINTPTSSTFSNNLFNTTTGGTSPWFYFDESAHTYAQAVSILSMTNSSNASPALVDETAIPPRFWSDPSLPAPAPILPLTTLVAPYMVTAGSPATDKGAKF